MYLHLLMTHLYSDITNEYILFIFQLTIPSTIAHFIVKVFTIFFIFHDFGSSMYHYIAFIIIIFFKYVYLYLKQHFHRVLINFETFHMLIKKKLKRHSF